MDKPWQSCNQQLFNLLQQNIYFLSRNLQSSLQSRKLKKIKKSSNFPIYNDKCKFNNFPNVVTQNSQSTYKTNHHNQHPSLWNNTFFPRNNIKNTGLSYHAQPKHHYHFSNQNLNSDPPNNSICYYYFPASKTHFNLRNCLTFTKNYDLNYKISSKSTKSSVGSWWQLTNRDVAMIGHKILLSCSDHLYLRIRFCKVGRLTSIVYLALFWACICLLCWFIHWWKSWIEKSSSKLFLQDGKDLYVLPGIYSIVSSATRTWTNFFKSFSADVVKCFSDLLITPQKLSKCFRQTVNRLFICNVWSQFS